MGSVTKVFTSQLLADTVECGKVKLDDPIEKFFGIPSKPRHETEYDNPRPHSNGNCDAKRVNNC